MISGADVPRAMSERFATVSFHTRTVSRCTSRVSGCVRCTTVSWLVISSIELMKTSEMIDTPRNTYSRPSRYAKARSSGPSSSISYALPSSGSQ
jgi:hypothetical protein